MMRRSRASLRSGSGLPHSSDVPVSRR
jgi:hypothetical protein